MCLFTKLSEPRLQWDRIQTPTCSDKEKVRKDVGNNFVLIKLFYSYLPPNLLLFTLYLLILHTQSQIIFMKLNEVTC
jgi:hypothetical protein